MSQTETDVHADPPATPAESTLSANESATRSRTFVAESPQVLERIITAPAAGEFTVLPPDVVTSEGEVVHAGQVVGTIDRNSGPVDVVSPHTGFLMGLLALPGERVRPQQPLAWVRVPT